MPPLAITGTRTASRHRAGQLDVEALARALLVDGGQQDLAGAELDRALGPVDDVEPGVLAAVVGIGLPAAVRRCAWPRSTAPCIASRSGCATSVISSGRATAAVLIATLSAPERSSHLDVVERAHAAADRDRNEHLLGGARARCSDRLLRS